MDDLSSNLPMPAKSSYIIILLNENAGVVDFSVQVCDMLTGSAECKSMMVLFLVCGSLV